MTAVEHRDKEFKLSRETKSAYYYGHKTGATEGVDKSDTATAQKRVILQNVSDALTQENIEHAYFVFENKDLLRGL